MEKARRRRILLRVILPILLVVMGVAVYMLTRSDFVRQLFSGHSHSGGCCESGELMAGDGDGSFRGPGRFEGYEAAKIKILAIIPGATPRYGDFTRVLHDAIDNKPSEFYVQHIDLFDLNEESAAELVGAYCTAIVINGQKEFTVPDGKGGTRTVTFMENVNPDLSAPDLVTVLNQLHAEHYGPSAKPVVTLPEKEPDAESEAVARDLLPKVVPADQAQTDTAADSADGAAPVIRLTLPAMKAGE